MVVMINPSIDIEHCPHCGGTLKVIVAILESGAITKILDHLGLPAQAPPRAPAQIFDPFEPTDPVLAPFHPHFITGLTFYPWACFARSAKTRQNL